MTFSNPSLTMLAPAKLNLFLHVTGRRADGYHELQTLFQLLDYGDELTFRPAEPRQLALTVEPEYPNQILPLADNLVMKAARLLAARAKPGVAGVAIHLHKRLPSGAGLGGGSSDAAACLLGLRQLWQLAIDDEELAAIGLGLGADVPVFVRGHSAWASGIGERLEAVAVPPAWYLVITPDCRVSTADIFSAGELTRDSPGITMADFLAGRCRNDCEPVTRSLFAEVDAALNWLNQHGVARMSGTGGSVFAAFASREAARGVLAQMPDGWQGFVARGIDRTPDYRVE
ncbi:MAG: 4-(cytidine 5'-diphospho)-2-C-methyl-D-erythritol kinase [Pseudohongiellaceae bacterium]